VDVEVCWTYAVYDAPASSASSVAFTTTVRGVAQSEVVKRSCVTGRLMRAGASPPRAMLTTTVACGRELRATVYCAPLPSSANKGRPRISIPARSLSISDISTTERGAKKADDALYKGSADAAACPSETEWTDASLAPSAKAATTTLIGVAHSVALAARNMTKDGEIETWPAVLGETATTTSARGREASRTV